MEQHSSIRTFSQYIGDGDDLEQLFDDIVCSDAFDSNQATDAADMASESAWDSSSSLTELVAPAATMLSSAGTDSPDYAGKCGADLHQRSSSCPTTVTAAAEEVFGPTCRSPYSYFRDCSTKAVISDSQLFNLEGLTAQIQADIPHRPLTSSTNISPSSPKSKVQHRSHHQQPSSTTAGLALPLRHHHRRHSRNDAVAASTRSPTFSERKVLNARVTTPSKHRHQTKASRRYSPNTMQTACHMQGYNAASDNSHEEWIRRLQLAGQFPDTYSLPISPPHSAKNSVEEDSTSSIMSQLRIQHLKAEHIDGEDAQITVSRGFDISAPMAQRPALSRSTSEYFGNASRRTSYNTFSVPASESSLPPTPRENFSFSTLPSPPHTASSAAWTPMSSAVPSSTFDCNFSTSPSNAPASGLDTLSFWNTSAPATVQNTSSFLNVNQSNYENFASQGLLIDCGNNASSSHRASVAHHARFDDETTEDFSRADFVADKYAHLFPHSSPDLRLLRANADDSSLTNPTHSRQPSLLLASPLSPESQHHRRTKAKHLARRKRSTSPSGPLLSSSTPAPSSISSVRKQSTSTASRRKSRIDTNSSPTKSKSRNNSIAIPSKSSSSAKAAAASAGGGFVNFTPNDSDKILTGVAPSGSSKTKMRREREAKEREIKFREMTVQALREGKLNELLG